MATPDLSGFSSLSSTTEAGEEAQQELAHHLETLRELGPEYNDAVAASLMCSLEPLIDQRIRQVGGQSARNPATNEHQERRKTLALILGFAIPLTAIAGATAGLLAIGLLWVALFIIAIVVTTQSLPYNH
ncbi:MAG TPA: hypothetical protein VKU87_02760 [Thermomicrobiaceae bacterium]|nr:hypothetical protein [Thermomicrobiaceae bacterium]